MPGWKGLFSRAGLNTDGSNINAYRGNITARNFPGVLAGVPSGYSSNTWYVDSDKTTSGNGQSWVQAYKTVTEALAAAGDHDVILIQKGIYDEGAVLNITQEGLKMFGMNTTDYMFGTTSLKASAANHIIFTVNANEVEIGNLAFIQNNANKCISVATTVSTYKTHIRNCHFGSGAATYGVDGGAGVYDSVDVIIENCSFTIGGGLVGARLNGTRCAIISSNFQIGTASTGYVHTPTTGNRPYTRVLGCLFHTVDVANGIGITVTGTPTVGFLTIDGCHFIYFADNNHAVSTRTGYCGLNWRDAAVLPVT